MSQRPVAPRRPVAPSLPRPLPLPLVAPGALGEGLLEATGLAHSTLRWAVGEELAWRRSRVGLASGGQEEYAMTWEAPRRRNDALAQVVIFACVRCLKMLRTIVFVFFFCTNIFVYLVVS